MAENKIITLDLTYCKYLGELHERIRVAFLSLQMNLHGVLTEMFILQR